MALRQCHGTRSLLRLGNDFICSARHSCTCAACEASGLKSWRDSVEHFERVSVRMTLSSLYLPRSHEQRQSVREDDLRASVKRQLWLSYLRMEKKSRPTDPVYFFTEENATETLQ